MEVEVSFKVVVVGVSEEEEIWVVVVVALGLWLLKEAVGYVFWKGIWCCRMKDVKVGVCGCGLFVVVELVWVYVVVEDAYVVVVEVVVYV